MNVVRDNIWLCIDCTLAAVNGDLTGVDSDARVAKIEAGLAKLGPRLVPDFDAEEGDGIDDDFADCECCWERSFGTFHRFAILDAK